MPHFSKDLLDAEAESLTFLHDLLHGPGAGCRGTGTPSGRPASAPSIREGRFVGGRAGKPGGDARGGAIGGNPGRTAPVRRRRPASLIGA